MRIVFYTPTCFLDSAINAIREMSRTTEVHLIMELSPEGWQSALFDAVPRKLSSGISPADPILRECFPAGVRAYWRDAASFNLVVHNCRKSIHPATWWVSHQAAKFIRGLRPDVVHLYHASLRLAWVLPELVRIPLALSVHDPEEHQGEHNWRTDLARWLTFRHVQRFILHNKALQERFCRGYGVSPEKVDIVKLGVYDVFREWIDSTGSEEKQTVLFFGRLSEYKGLEVLYQAAPRVAEKVPGVRFVIAGQPVRGYSLPDSPLLPNGGQVKVIDRYIDNAYLVRLIRQSTVVVCPYTTATQSGVVLTAFALGKPVVATRVGGLPEYVKDGVTGYVVPPRNPQALAEGMVRMLQDPEIRQQMSGNVQAEAATTLSWDSIVEEMISVYQHAIDET